MENTPYLYDMLVQVLRQHRNWLDLRHLKTLAWMMVGLIHSSSISLCAWAPFVVSRARYSQSTVRRFRRWLDNDQIEVHTLCGHSVILTFPVTAVGTVQTPDPVYRYTWHSAVLTCDYCSPHTTRHRSA